MPETETIYEALLAFHKDAEKLDLKKTARGGHADYLPLDGAMEQIRPLLAAHGLLVRHRTGCEDGAWFAETIVVHAATTAEISSGPFPLKVDRDNAQGWGGALTYARRYTLMAVLGLVADNDDDGAGSGRQRTRRAPAATGKINAAQRNELMAAVREAKIPTDRASEIIKEVAGVDKSTDIPAEKFADVLRVILAVKT